VNRGWTVFAATASTAIARQPRNEGPMVMLSTNSPKTPQPTYEVLDDRGTAIGRVVLPSSPAMVGAGKGTVYLRRQA
jgi:hypothetical protein